METAPAVVVVEATAAGDLPSPEVDPRVGMEVEFGPAGGTAAPAVGRSTDPAWAVETVVVVAAGTLTSTLVTAPLVIAVAALPAESSTANVDDARRDATPEDPAAIDTVTFTVHRVLVAWTTESTLAMLVRPKSDAVTVEQSIASLPDNENAAVVPVTLAWTAASVRTGAVTSAIVTTTDAGEPTEIDVRAFPCASSTEKPCAARRELVPEEPGATDDVAEIEHLEGLACDTRSICSMFVSRKSAAVRVPQSIGSSPVRVKTRAGVVTVAEDAASTRTGAVVSLMTNVRSRVPWAWVAVCAAVARTTQLPVPEWERVRVPEFTVHDEAVVDTTE